MRTDLIKLFLPILLIFITSLDSDAIIVGNLDYIILTNGEELYGKIDKISKTEVQFAPYYQKGFTYKKGEDTTIDISKIYMIKYKDRGNVYFTLDGSRKSGEKQKIDKSANIIYLIDGAEIPAWDISYNNDRLDFRVSKVKKKELPTDSSVALDAVFMIKYADGSLDIINDVEKIRESERQKKEEKPEENIPEPRIKVIFYTVKTGNTLTSIANEYDVTISQLREWNDIDSKIKDNTRLKPGLQLMIQKEITE